MSDVAAFVYRNIPYFLTDADYHRMDSLLRTHDYVGSQLNNDMEMLMFPSGSMLSDNIGRDPLNLFTPVVERLSNGAQSLNYELYNGAYLHTRHEECRRDNRIALRFERDRQERTAHRAADGLLRQGREEFPGVSIRLTVVR